MATAPPLILLVEDDDRIADAVCSGLRSEGFEVDRASEGHEARVLFEVKEGPFDPKKAKSILSKTNIKNKSKIRNHIAELGNCFFLNEKQEFISGPELVRIKHLDEIESPYVNGLFDEFLKSDKHYIAEFQHTKIEKYNHMAIFLFSISRGYNFCFYKYCVANEVLVL